MAAKVAARVTKPLPVTPAAPLEVSSSTPRMRQGLGQCERGVGGLGDEHGRHGQVDRGAVQVEGVAGGDHQADNRLGAAEVLQLVHHAGRTDSEEEVPSTMSSSSLM